MCKFILLERNEQSLSLHGSLILLKNIFIERLWIQFTKKRKGKQKICYIEYKTELLMLEHM